MLKLKTEKGFEKDIIELKKSGKYNDEIFNEIKSIIEKLQHNDPISQIYRRHKLVGDLKGYEALHIQGDLVMIFKIKDDELILVMLGKHTKVYKRFK